MTKMLLAGTAAAPWPAVSAACATVKFALVILGLVYHAGGGVELVGGPAAAKMSPALASLRRRWWLAVALAVAVLAAAFCVGSGRPGASARPDVGRPWPCRRPRLSWPSSAATCPPTIPPLRPRLSPGWARPTGLPLGRGLLLAVLAGFLLLPRPSGALAWAPAILYTVAIAADLLDGALARLTGRVTGWARRWTWSSTAWACWSAVGAGGALRAVAVALSQRGRWRATSLWPGLCVAGAAGPPHAALTPSTFRRIAAGLQMAFISVILWPLFGPPATDRGRRLFRRAVPGRVHARLAGGQRRGRSGGAPAIGGSRGGMLAAARWLPPVLRLGACSCWRAFSWRLPCGRGAPGGLSGVGRGRAGAGQRRRAAGAGFGGAAGPGRGEPVWPLWACWPPRAPIWPCAATSRITAACWWPSIGVLTLGGGAFALWPVG